MLDYFTFASEDAKQYGVDGAIMLHHIRYWVAKNEANDRNFHEGKYWTYNSQQAFAKLFPFWTARKIGRLLTKLEDEGAIVSGNFNDKRYDRTKWFTLTNAIDNLSSMHMSNMTNGYVKNDSTIPDNYQETKQNTTHIVLPFDSDLFKESWTLWKKYKKEEHKFGYKSAVSEQAALKKLSNLSNNNEQDAIELIEHAIAQGWKGFYNNRTSTKNKTFDQEKFFNHIESL